MPAILNSLYDVETGPKFLIWCNVGLGGDAGNTFSFIYFADKQAIFH